MKLHIPSQRQLLRRDKWLLSCLTWVPVMLAIMLWWIFSHGIARDLPIGVVDLSHSSLSRTLSRDYDATSAMSVDYQFQDVAQARQALIQGDVYAYVIIPANFDKDIYRGMPPQVSVFYNSQFILVGKLIKSSVAAAQGTFNAKVDVMRNLAKGNTTTLSAMGQALPVRTQITALFNKNSNYAQFLISAIVPALWQISMVASTILILAANQRAVALTTWLSERPLATIARTLAVYVPLFLAQGVAFLIWFYQLIEWPMHGSLSALILAQLVTVIACMIMGSFFFFMTLDAARALSLGGAFTAPSLAFMGITFPATDMNSLAQFWRSLLPISHYIEVQVAQVSYGADVLTSLYHLLPMAGYVVPLGLTLLFVRKHLAKARQEEVSV